MTNQGRNYERERELIEAQSLDAKIRMFINRYAPEGESRNFEGDLIHIVQRIYWDAQQPFHKALAEGIARQPMFPVPITASGPGERK